MWKASDVFKPGVRLDYRWRDDIDGEDASLKVPIPGFPYPAPVKAILAVAAGSHALRATTACRGLVRRGGLFTPLYLDLHGPQSSEKFHFSLEIGTSF